MQDKVSLIMKDIEFSVLNSVSKIGRSEWDEVFGDIPEGYQFYELLESSSLKDFEFYYFILRKEGRAVLIAPMFIAPFPLDIALKGWLKKTALFIRKFFPNFLVLKTLFCGSPFGEHADVGIRDDCGDSGALFVALAKRIEGFRKERDIPLVLFKDFLSKHTAALTALLPLGFFRVRSFPSAIAKLNFSSFEDYLKSLGHSSRKNLRRRIKKANSLFKIEVREAERIDDLVDDIYQLYLNTYYQGKTKFEMLTRDFFLNVTNKMAPHVRYFLYYINGRLSAFNLCFVYPELFIDKFIGFDYNISRQAELYFLSWCYNVQWCLAKGVRFYETGQTDYAPKMQLGAKLLPLYAYLKHKNRFINLILKLSAVVLIPKDFDDGAL